MSDTNTARERLLDVMSFTECANGGTTPEALLAEYDAARRDELLPPWEAVYESASFTSRLLAYCQDEVTAKAAAEAWLREHCTDATGLVWTPDPVMCGDGWEQWSSLSSTAEDGTPLDTEIVVRQRAARTTSAPTSRHCATPNSALPCGRHCRHDLCADCDRCCTCQCATAPTSQEQL